MRRKTIGILMATVLALAGTVLLVSYVNGADERAIAGEKTVGVLVVDQPIKQGVPAETLEGDVTIEHVPAKVRAEGAVTSLSSLRGLVTTAELLPGEQVLRARFVKPDKADSVSGLDTSSLVKVSIALEPERMLGGSLRAGDLVAVFASTSSPDMTHVILHQVPIVNVQGNGADKSGSGGSSGSSSPTAKLMVTLALSEPAAENLVWAAEHGKIWLSLEPKNADSTKTRIVTNQNAFQ
jgi:pilus assembly protein CpaB